MRAGPRRIQSDERPSVYPVLMGVAGVKHNTYNVHLIILHTRKVPRVLEKGYLPHEVDAYVGPHQTLKSAWNPASYRLNPRAERGPFHNSSSYLIEFHMVL